MSSMQANYDPPEPTDFENAVELTAWRINRAWDGTTAVAPVRTQEGARIVWESIYGALRGRVPYPVPADLMGVAVSAGLRVTKGFVESGSVFLDRGNYNGQADFRPWSGWLIPERVVINRYRQRTA